MQYIILDLEWNQPLSYHSAAYKSVEGKLLFEMIQIGAVKLGDDLRPVDSFTQLIRPQHYVKLHPRIARITHIDQEELAEAPEFCEAVEAFAAWCGQDYALLTWGCDDISVLHQNMTFYHCQTTLGKIYDIQRLFGAVIGNAKERKGLKAAMEHFEIVPDENLPFHNAVNDAYYTGLVFARLPEPDKVLDYPLSPRKLQHLERDKRESAAILRSRSLRDALRTAAVQRPPCPICGKKMQVPEGYIRQRDDQYMALADCEQHGLVFVKLRFAKNEEGKKVLVRACALADEQNKAYVHTKHLQWQQKMALQAAAEAETS